MKQGVYRITNEEYREDKLCPVPSLSRSTIKDLLFKTPRHAFCNHPRLSPDCIKEEKHIFDIGSAAHFMFLEGQDNVKVIEEKDWRKDVAKLARDEARESGLLPLLLHEFESVKEMVSVAHLALIECMPEIVLRNSDFGEAELSYYWKEGAEWCRCRPDWISKDRDIILDYKTTGQLASVFEYGRIAAANGLDIQEAFYCKGVRAVDGTQPDFTFMVQETSPPYLCSFFDLDMLFKDMGEQKVKAGLKLWQKCRASNKWPGYPKGICTLEAPPWALTSWEMKRYGGDDEL